MVPADFGNFLIVCVGASASFIGLLFVAISLVIARADNAAGLAFTDRRLAESALAALTDVFFVALAALVPHINIGYPALVLAFLGLWSSLRLLRRLRDHERTGDEIMSRREEAIWIIVSSIVYVVQILYALRLIGHPSDLSAFYGMMTIIVLLFAAGLIRAWELTGIRRR